MLPNYPLATLALADGTLFHGYAIGALGHTVGEVVFNTALTGYQEILTDPSYNQQIVTLTYPHIGNTGVNLEDIEANKVYAAGLIVKNLPVLHSNFRANQSLTEYLKNNNIIAIAGIDTRKLTRILRTTGSQNGAIVTGSNVDEISLEKARGFAGLNNLDLAKEVCTTQAYSWKQGEWDLEHGYKDIQLKSDSKKEFHVVAYDFGVKQNILRMLAQRGCKLTVVPAQTSFEQVCALNPDGVFLSNGPGDPSACTYAIEAIKKVLSNQIPVFGICLGHQILALACGANTIKMKFGHHGANHPVQDLLTSKVVITSQNHGFAVDEDTLPDDIIPTHKSLFDGSLQGIAHKTLPAFGFQGHPEASPGPHDLADLFDKFVSLMHTKASVTA
ncbi:MAG: hypothetical protein RLZZ210_246 [Pseudomonadota bacterium]